MGRDVNGGKWLSKAAILWALYEAPDVPARLVSTLIAVAVYAGADGCGAYPSAATVAMLTRKSESQAKRDIAELEKLGLLLPGDERVVKDIRADRRPKVYDLPMPRGASERPPSEGPRGASGYRTGRIWEQNGGRPDAPEEVLKTSGRRARDSAGAQSPPAGQHLAFRSPPCPYCGREVDWREEIDPVTEVGITMWRELLDDALAGEVACSSEACQKASCYCIRCQAPLNDVNLICRACRVREVAP